MFEGDSAQQLIDIAPLGALVAYSDVSPHPPARLKRKLAAWRRFNGVGRLDSVTPAEMRGAHEVPARFKLHVGDFCSYGAIVLPVRMCFDVRSPLTFTMVDAEPGTVVAFVTDGVHLELGGVFADQLAAFAWLDQPRDEQVFLVEVRRDRSLRRLAPALAAWPLEEDRTWPPGPRIGSTS